MTLKPNDSFDIYSDPAMYDCESNHTSDIPFYLELAREHGDHVLELACGTGRISIPMAQAGFDVTGLDISEPMILHARKKAAKAGVNVEFLENDCRTFSLGQKFNLIMMPYNAIAHIHDRPSHEALFARVKEHLAPGGRFVLSMYCPHEKYLFRDPDKRFPCMEFELPDGTPVVITENNVYDKATQISHIKWYYQIGNEVEIVRDLNMRQFFPAELDALIYYNGFELVDKFGDYEGTPFESSSRQQVCVCRRR